MSTPDQPSLLRAIAPLVLAALALVAIRVVLEVLEVSWGRYVGVYFGMPVVLLVFGKVRPWTRGWRALARGIALLGLLVFVPANIGSYTAANFDLLAGARFGEDKMMTAAKAAEMLGGDPEAPTDLHRAFGGVATGLLTGVINTLWCLVFATLFVWRPKWQPVRKR